MTVSLADQFIGKLEDRSASIAVIGLGYVGLPLALAFCEKGFPVVGFDVDPKKVEALQQGESYIAHIDGSRLPAALATGRFQATTEFDELATADAVLIAVPTPLTRQREPDLSYVVATSEQIGARLKPGQLVVLESTTYPGTTDELVRDVLEKSGLSCGQDFFLAYSPEREDPGNQRYDTKTIPKVVGGVDEVSGRLAVALYRAVISEVVPVASARTAEATKLTENIFRAVNIALVNELKVVYDRMGIDVWDVLDAAATKPFGFMRFNPGPGLGGHCIPLDPFYLTWRAREFGLATRFIELAGEINVAMPRYVIDKLQSALNDRGKPLNDSKILVLVLAYKQDVDDPRESPSFELIELLRQGGAEVSYHDPHIARMPKMRSWPNLKQSESVPLTADLVAQMDAVLISTNHTAVDYGLVAERASLIIDTRGVYQQPRANVVKA
jgi:UDP-N-acetyl-D-glucosamine dehydrogenase